MSDILDKITYDKLVAERNELNMRLCKVPHRELGMRQLISDRLTEIRTKLSNAHREHWNNSHRS